MANKKAAKKPYTLGWLIGDYAIGIITFGLWFPLIPLKEYVRTHR